jgi:hypothetical protein
MIDMGLVAAQPSNSILSFKIKNQLHKVKFTNFLNVTKSPKKYQFQKPSQSRFASKRCYIKPEST